MRKFNFSLGLALFFCIILILCWLTSMKSVPFGMYCRMSPLVFSIPPFCEGAHGGSLLRWTDATHWLSEGCNVLSNIQQANNHDGRQTSSTDRPYSYILLLRTKSAKCCHETATRPRNPTLTLPAVLQVRHMSIMALGYGFRPIFYALFAIGRRQWHQLRYCAHHKRYR